MLFIAEVMRHERPYRISEVIELCVKYKEIVSNELCDRQVYLAGRYVKRSQKLEMKWGLTQAYVHLERDFLAEACKFLSMYLKV